MSDCVICAQRTVQQYGMYCSYSCFAMSVAGIAEVNARHILKKAQRDAREAAWASADKEGVLVSAQEELEAYSEGDDGIDR